MNKLSFSLPAMESPWRRTWTGAASADAANLSEMDLRYKYFGVNVEMIVDGVVIISKERFVTLVDLALSLRTVAEGIARGEDAAFGFTESAEVVRLRPVGANVSVMSTKSPTQAIADRDGLLEILSDFVDAAHRRLIEEIPALQENPVLQRIDPMTGN